MDHDFPNLLAQAAIASWPAEHAELAPTAERLGSLLATCFLASLLREEERPISFRMLLCAPGEVPEDGSPEGLQVLVLSRPRAFSTSELRRLSPAVEFHRALVGVECDGENARIWGVIHSGPAWVRMADGGLRGQTDLPPRVVVHVKGAGDLAVFCGPTPLASLSGGRITQRELDVFESGWLSRHFEAARNEALELHRLARAGSEEAWAELDPSFVRVLGQHVVRRALAVMRRERHGGTILFLTAACAEDVVGRGSEALVRLKYVFEPTIGQRRFRTALVAAMSALARSAPPGRVVGWEDYSASGAAEIAVADDALFDVGHLFAGLSAVDGALVLNERLEILGFGAEISGAIPAVDTVWKAVDVEASQVVADPAETFGTRHRSVFRLCAARPEVLAAVVSQDGQVRFVKQLGERVVYFEHRMVGAL